MLFTKFWIQFKWVIFILHLLFLLLYERLIRRCNGFKTLVMKNITVHSYSLSLFLPCQGAISIFDIMSLLKQYLSLSNSYIDKDLVDTFRSWDALILSVNHFIKSNTACFLFLLGKFCIEFYVYFNASSYVYFPLYFFIFFETWIVIVLSKYG